MDASARTSQFFSACHANRRTMLTLYWEIGVCLKKILDDVDDRSDTFNTIWAYLPTQNSLILAMMTLRMYAERSARIYVHQPSAHSE